MVSDIRVEIQDTSLKLKRNRFRIKIVFLNYLHESNFHNIHQRHVDNRIDKVSFLVDRVLLHFRMERN